MSDSLRSKFPNACFLPFNPKVFDKLKEAEENPSNELIIVDTTLPAPETLSREKWIIMNTATPILEVGCHDTHLYRDVGWVDWENYYGLDLDLWSQALNFVQGDAHQLPYKDKSFPTLTFAEILEHVEEPKRCLLECMRVASSRVLISIPDEFHWSFNVLPFMDKFEKDKIDGITHRQQIDKNSRWLSGCLNPKTEIASWDEEKYEHLWHVRHYYHPDDVGTYIEKIPSGKTKHPECNLVELMDDVVETYNLNAKVKASWSYEKLKYWPWAFHQVMIVLDGSQFMSAWEFRKKVEESRDWYSQFFVGENQNVVVFLRRV